MELEEAQKIVRDLMDTAVYDFGQLTRRIKELQAEQAQDPHETTAAQIEKLKARHAKKLREATALAAVVATF